MVVLAALDGRKPDRVATVGADLASTYDDELVALHVMTEESFDSWQGTIEDVSSDEFADFSVSKAEQTARRLADEVVDASADASNVEIEPVGRVGEPVEEILAIAEEYDARYLVVGGRKRTPVGKALFGSSTQSILLEAERPVVTVMESE